MTGKSKCRILKEIRRQIAQDNDIAFVTSECKHQGECAGTCPKCEAEVRYLEQELAKRQKAGKAVAVAGIAATILVSTAGCLPSQTAGDPLPDPSSSYNQTLQGDVPPTTLDILPGVPYETEPTEGELMGEPMPEPTEASEIMGDLVAPQE